MQQSRRNFLTTAAAATGTTFLPFATHADGQNPDRFDTPRGPITVHPMGPASIVMETPTGTIYVDPVGDPDSYTDWFRRPDLILITHEHEDHYSEATLTGIAGEATRMFTNAAVFDRLPGHLKTFSQPLANRDQNFFDALGIEVIPAYNTTQSRLEYHPRGRDNGYVLSFDGFRIYISGDTEGTPEMRSLADIDLAFVCMALPTTMDASAAASAVNAFAPTYCYPYHYQGTEGGTEDPADFAAMLTGTEPRFGEWS